MEKQTTDALGYLIQYSWIDNTVAEKIIEIAKEHPSTRLIANVLGTLGNKIFKALQNDSNIQKFLDDHPNFQEPTADEFSTYTAYFEAMFGEMEAYIKDVVASLELGKLYQASLSPFFLIWNLLW